ncbi:MAG TPA: low temperature requirement protein A, partial [Acidimicrobiia bacterium]|nr:low temperature requirement protein A [Acidimicrobiia bacterium]
PRRRRHAPRIPRVNAELREQETVKPLELFFDLVFVLAFTQCSALMVGQPTWQGLGRGVLVLAVLWWAWAAYAWLTSVVEPEEGAVRIVMFVAMASLLVCGLCVPEVFGDRGLTFAIAYAIVRAAHIALFMIASRDDPALRSSVRSFGTSTALAVATLIAASFFEGSAQMLMWLAVVAIDTIGAQFRGGGWRLVPSHFAERHNLIIILALGESVIALGFGATVDLTAAVLTVAVLGMALVCALWWIYFDVVAIVTRQRLERATPGVEQNRLARDCYTYIHFALVGGIVVAAVGLEATIAHNDEPLHAEQGFALLGGIALYLLGHVALRLRSSHSWNWQRLALAIVFLTCIPLATKIDSIVTLTGAVIALWLMIAYETHRYGELRYPLRHNQHPEPGAPIGAERFRQPEDAESSPDEAGLVGGHGLDPPTA